MKPRSANHLYLSHHWRFILSLTIEEIKNLAATFQSIATVVSFIIGGIWVYSKYIHQQERYPNIEFSTDVQFIGKQNDEWIVELIAMVRNKGKAQHRMEEFLFDLNAIEKNRKIQTSEKWGNQVDFPVLLVQGSFLPKQYKFFFIDPGVEAKYSFLTKVPATASFLVLHSWFKYGDSRQFSHTAERTVAVPQEIVAASASANSITQAHHNM